MVRGPLCIAALAFLTQAHVGLAPALAIPPGYFVDSTQAFEPRPTRQDYDDGDFTLAIRREFSDSTEARLLGIAEATYPPRDDLVTLSVVHRTEIGPDTTRVPLWWYDGVGVHRVPYAVTAGALDYYVKLTDDRAPTIFGVRSRARSSGQSSITRPRCPTTMSTTRVRSGMRTSMSPRSRSPGDTTKARSSRSLVPIVSWS